MKIHMNNRKKPTSVVIELELGKSCEATLIAQSLEWFIRTVEENGLQFLWSGNYGLSKKIVKRIHQIDHSYYNKPKKKKESWN